MTSLGLTAILLNCWLRRDWLVQAEGSEAGETKKILIEREEGGAVFECDCRDEGVKGSDAEPFGTGMTKYRSGFLIGG